MKAKNNRQKSRPATGAGTQEQFLEHLHKLAGIPLSFEEVASVHGLDAKDFRKLVNEDAAVAAVWNAGRMAMLCRMRAALLKKACSGDIPAILAVEEMLSLDGEMGIIVRKTKG